MLRQYHKVAQEKINTINLFNENTSTWIVPSFTCASKTYQVKLIDKNENHKCNIKCIY